MRRIKQTVRSLWHPELLETRQVLAAIFPAYVDGVFTLGDANSPDGSPYGLANTFGLASLPTATKTIFLDFDGHHSVNNSWGHDIVFPPYNSSGSSSSFSNSERVEIQKIFQNIAEDYLPFEVNVTTADPGLAALTKSGAGDQTWGVRDLHTQATAGFGNGIGGVAYLNSFNDSIDNPVFSFNKGINNGAMTGSHEVGHSLGLSHDGLFGQSYHPGTGSGSTGWGPIMGAPFNKNVTQWSNGDYSGATTTQDDLSIITKPANGFGYRTDDYGSSIGTASTLTDVDGSIFAWGIIERNTDLDFFEFTTGAGTVTFDINPFGENPNLDIEARLYDSVGDVLGTSNPLNGLDASFNLNLAAGTYFLSIDGVGKPGVYSDYGSLGFYSIDATIVPTSGGQIDITPVNNGVAVADDATGSGYLMYSAENVHERFAGANSPNPFNANHLIGVRYDGGWQYNDNRVWVPFSPVASDVLLASANFSTDTVTSLQGTSGSINGVAAGYATGDVAFAANVWAGSANLGEFGVTGTNFTPNEDPGSNTFVTPLNKGVAIADDATGGGYLMYSAESVHERFAGANSPNPSNADHLIGVRYNGGWEYNDNTRLGTFHPRGVGRAAGQRDNFSTDTVTSLEGTGGTINGLAAGYASGDLVFAANVWDGDFNLGEFGVTGTSFVANEDPGSTVFVTPVNNGVAVTDDAVGTGYLMYSEQSVFDRFAGANVPNSFNANHIIAVRYNGGWQYNDNLTWNSFTPAASDVLLATVDFTNDTVSSLQGTGGSVNGIVSGYASGDLTFAPNVWAGAFNFGEFGVTGSSFVPNSAASAGASGPGRQHDFR